MSHPTGPGRFEVTVADLGIVWEVRPGRTSRSTALRPYLWTLEGT